MAVLALILLTCVLVITLPWDLLVWLTGNEDNWRHTGFRAPLIAVAGIILIQIMLVVVEGFFNVMDRASEFVLRGGRQNAKPKSEATLAEREDRYKWANRLPPHDKDGQ